MSSLGPTITSSSDPAPPRSSPPFQCESLIPARVRTCSNAKLAAAAPPAILIPRFSPDRPRRHENSPQESRSEEHTSELQSLTNLVCRLLLEKKKKKKTSAPTH